MRSETARTDWADDPSAGTPLSRVRSSWGIVCGGPAASTRPFAALAERATDSWPAHVDLGPCTGGKGCGGGLPATAG
jgi:hypothetical protein